MNPFLLLFLLLSKDLPSKDLEEIPSKGLPSKGLPSKEDQEEISSKDLDEG